MLPWVNRQTWSTADTAVARENRPDDGPMNNPAYTARSNMLARNKPRAANLSGYLFKPASVRSKIWQNGTCLSIVVRGKKSSNLRGAGQEIHNSGKTSLETPSEVGAGPFCTLQRAPARQNVAPRDSGSPQRETLFSQQGGRWLPSNRGRQEAAKDSSTFRFGRSGAWSLGLPGGR